MKDIAAVPRRGGVNDMTKDRRDGMPLPPPPPPAGGGARVDDVEGDNCERIPELIEEVPGPPAVVEGAVEGEVVALTESAKEAKSSAAARRECLELEKKVKVLLDEDSL